LAWYIAIVNRGAAISQSDSAREGVIGRPWFSGGSKGRPPTSREKMPRKKLCGSENGRTDR